MTTQQQNRGLVKAGKNQIALVNRPLPGPRDDYIQVRTIAVALNPADWQNLDEEFPSDAVPMLLGNDLVGIIEGVGRNLTTRWKAGDRVICCVHGVNQLNPEDGAFAEHVTARGDISMCIPASMSATAAVTLPSAILTIALGLYVHLELPMPPTIVPADSWIFVYGGSSASGTMAIQFAKLSGCKVVTTCSPRNFDLVKSFGADVAYDYRDPSCGSKIRALCSDTLTKVFDTIATPATAQMAADAMSSTGGTYVNLMGVDTPRGDIKSIFFLAYTAMGRAYLYEGESWPVVKRDYDLTKRFVLLAEQLFEQGKIRPHPASVREGGIEAIPEGIEYIRQGQVSGEKLVYIIGEE